MPKVITVANQKGGCAKTTTTANLGAALAMSGKTVLVIDLDPQANLSLGFGYELGEDELSSYHLITGRAPLNDVIRRTDINDLYVVPSAIELSGAEIELTQAIAGEKKLYNVLKKSNLAAFDYIIIDTPPFFSNVLTNGLSTSQVVLIPVELRRYGIAGLRQLLGIIEAVKEGVNEDLDSWYILPVMTDLRQKEDREVLEFLKNHYDTHVLKTNIKRNIKVAEAVKEAMPVVAIDKNCPGSLAYIELATEIEGVLNNVS
ncbi:ParA family protein [Peptococcaceae bacterium 1198_IL3148]